MRNLNKKLSSMCITTVLIIVPPGLTSAQEMEPEPVGVDPPGGVTFVADGNSAIDVGGENWRFSGFNFYPRGCSALFWAPYGEETSIQIAMDGIADLDSESKLALSPDGTNLGTGVAIWNGSTTAPLAAGGSAAVLTRFVLTVVDGLGDPIFLFPAPVPIGAAVPVDPFGGSFVANLQFEASADGTNWAAAGPYFESLATPANCNDNTCLTSSFQAQFFCVPPENLPPVVMCEESVNPSGNNVPKAGDSNEDGFYMISSEDEEDDPNPPVYVGDGNASFGPFASGSVVKITKAPGAPPSSKPMGGPNSAVAAHITLNADGLIWAVDSFGDRSDVVTCLVPPPPK
jgi:hypothetical protein